MDENWHVFQTNYPRSRCIHQLVAAQAARAPDAVAAVDGSRRLTYRQLDRQANRLANHLRCHGVGHETFVGICLPRSLDMVVAQLAVLKAGGAYLPLDPDHPAARIAFMLSDTAAPVVLTLARLCCRLPASGAEVVCLDQDAARIESAPTSAPDDHARADNLAYIMYTSGSTGQPKGVCIPHRAVVRLVCRTNYVHFAPRDTVAYASNSSFDAATFEVWGALLNGARLVVVPPEVVVCPPEFAAFLHRHEITVLFVTPALFNMLAEHCAAVFGPVHQVFVGGDVMDPRSTRRVLAGGPPRRLLNVYGPTENTTFSCWHLVRDLAPDATSVPIGRPVANTEVYLLDGQRRPVSVGASGEIYLGGDGLARGYLNQPALTAERFVPHWRSDVPGARLFRTGDLGRYLPDGAIEFLGRLDDQVKLRGVRVEPGEVEAVLDRHRAVRKSVVVAGDDSTGERSLVAYVMPDRTALAQAQQRQVGHWRQLYDEVIYRQVADQPAAREDPTFNIAGWVSSYTGEPLGAEQMREQVTCTVERIQALHPDRMLEIGCGTGLLLFRLAPTCGSYLATDFSAAALDYIRGQLERTGPSVRLSHRSADDFSGIEAGSFDTVVLNSVVQHFPGAAYLTRVLAGAVAAVRPGGAVFVGDVRALHLAEAFYASAELTHAPACLATQRLLRSVQARARREQELLVDPGFFEVLARRLPGVCEVTVQLKRGRHYNELTRFRYDVVLRVGTRSGRAVAIRWLDWQDGMVLEDLERIVGAEDVAVGVRAMPNARVLEAVTAAGLLIARPGLGTVATLRDEVRRQTTGRGVDPEDLWDLGTRMDRTVEISWSASADPGAFDAVCYPSGVAGTRPAALFDSGSSTTGSRQRANVPGPSPSSLTNDPLLANDDHELVAELRRHLRKHLPEYMVPGAFVVLQRLPLTPHGKVNRRALPPVPGEQATNGGYFAPRSGVEHAVAAVWQRVLAVRRVGVHDNFFDIGGNSLKAAQVVTALRRAFDADIPMLRLFECPTVRLLAESLSSCAPVLEPTGRLDPDRDRGAARRARKRERLRETRVESAKI